ncbi:Armadillo type fold isoform 1 [Schistosoma japonicum]|uniref:Armadillo type fold isoform 1 n=2 Tax=Schistosoma japonicum TaxID=6182 RepID=A0A4Z2D2Y6_SCHJA|nr:Armadillo type fold isoform 1 [Schistosoma japonicum]
MSLDIINLLNSAACGDPDVMMPASQRLTAATQSDNCDNVCSEISLCVFSRDDRLTPDGRFLGLIYLKNMMFDSKIWHNISPGVKKKVEVLLFNYILGGAETSNFTNLVESFPRTNGIISELISRYVKNEWLKNNWSDSFWQNLLDWHAWSSLRSGLKAAASFRLPARRHAFNNIVKELLPSVINCFSSAITNLEANIGPCIKLSKLIYSCFNLTNRNDFIVVANGTDIFEYAFMVTVQALELAFRNILNAEKSSLMSVFRRRVSKLLLALFLSCPSETTDSLIEPILEHILIIISCPGSIQLDHKDSCAVKWLLGITYCMLCCRSPKYKGATYLTEQGKRKLELWMSQRCLLPNNKISSKWTYFMVSLFERWFLLTPNELQILTNDPEGCLSSGGIFSTSVESDAKNNSVYADLKSTWNVDCQANDLCKCNVETVLGISDSSQNTLTPQTCRQLTELIFTIYCRFYDEANQVLYDMVQSINAEADKPFVFEATMRLIQLCIPYFGTSKNWIALADHFITDGLAVGNSIHNTMELLPMENKVTSVAILTRTLCLLSRYSIQCNLPGDDGISPLKSNFNNALSHINRFLHRPSNWDQNISQKQLMLCVRLAAAYSLMWLLQLAVCPEDILALHSENLLSGTLFLIQDVKECETQIYVLTLLGNLIERIDIISYPQFIPLILNTLDHLWSLSSSNAALRASILNAVCLVVTQFNAFSECSEFLLELNTVIQSSIISLIQVSLDQVEDNRINGSEALFEPALRLWASLVEGPCATWSPNLMNLMPILVGDSTRLIQIDGADLSSNSLLKQSLLSRVDSGEQASLVFRIAYGTLKIVDETGGEILRNFLCQWSEPFWISILAVSFNLCSFGERVNLEDLYSQASCVEDENNTDKESEYRLSQLKLFIVWFTMYLEYECTERNVAALPSSTIGLLFLAARYCLIRAPEDSHSDVTPKATELRLELLARLVLYPNMWSYFIQLLQLVHKFSINDNNQLNLHLILQGYNSISQQYCYITMNELRNLLNSPISRWLARVDSLSNYIDRWCIAVAAITCLRHGVQTYTITDAQMSDVKLLENLAINDNWHAQWLELIINLIIQVLYDDDKVVLEDANTQFYHRYPIEISTVKSLKHRLRNELNLWQDQVGCPAMADALINCYVDPALRVQLESQLNQID